MKIELSVLFEPTAIFIGVISLAIYIFIIRPLVPSTRGPAHERGNRTRSIGTTGAAAGGAALSDGAMTIAQQRHNEQLLQTIPCSRVPPHVSDASASLAVNGGANLLVDGLVAFKHCRASSSSSSSSLLAATGAVESDETRKARAKLLSNLLEVSGSSSRSGSGANPPSPPPPPPPAKGGVVVVSIPIESVACPQQRRVLHLLATYYNLLVIMTVSQQQRADEFTEVDRVRAIATLRSGENGASGSSDIDESDAPLQQQQQQLTADILPTHRITVASTVTGRVAFVRQLQRVELVLDYDPEVLALLSRFGHRVIVYGNRESSSSSQREGAAAEADLSISKLGRAML